MKKVTGTMVKRFATLFLGGDVDVINEFMERVTSEMSPECQEYMEQPKKLYDPAAYINNDNVAEGLAEAINTCWPIMQGIIAKYGVLDNPELEEEFEDAICDAFADDNRWAGLAPVLDSCEEEEPEV